MADSAKAERNTGRVLQPLRSRQRVAHMDERTLELTEGQQGASGAELDVDELLERVSPFRLMREGEQRPLEMGDRLTIGRPRRCFVARLLQVGGRLGPALSPEGVVRQALHLFVG